MTAIACMRVVVGADLRLMDASALADLVTKMTSAYLESRWSWPRRHGLVAPFAFVLADPRATQLDPRELQALAADLHQKLFGQDGAGEIALLTFEGDQQSVMQFAAAQDADLRSFLRGENDLFETGRICRITAAEVVSLQPEDGPIVGVPPYEALEVEPAPTGVAFRGVYDARKETFIGSAAVWQDSASGMFLDIGVPTPTSTMDRDLQVVRAAARTSLGPQLSRLLIPISFSTLIKPAARGALALLFEPLPAAARRRIHAVVYETPRSPSFQALSQMHGFLQPHVGSMGLQISDPDFQIDSLPAGLVASVTLILPSADENVRIQSIVRFLGQADAYARKRVPIGVDNVRSRRELQTSLKFGGAYLSGPAVSGMLSVPIDITPCPVFSLPLHDWSVPADGALPPPLAYRAL